MPSLVSTDLQQKLRSCQRVWGIKNSPCRSGFVCSVFSVMVGLQYNWQLTRQNTESEGEPSKWHDKHKPHSLVWNEASKSTGTDRSHGLNCCVPLCHLSLFYSSPSGMILQSCSSCFPLCINNIAMQWEIHVTGSLCRNPWFWAGFILWYLQ